MPLLDEQVIPPQVLPVGVIDTPKRTMPAGTNRVIVLIGVDAVEVLDPTLEWTLEAYQVRGGQPDELLSRTSFRGGAIPQDDNDQPTTTLRWQIERTFRTGNQCFLRAIVRNRSATIGLTLQYWS